MRFVKFFGLLSLVIIIVAMLTSCSSSDDTATAEPEPIQTAPDFIGKIIEIHSIGENDVMGTILVEGKDFINSSDKYIVTIENNTIIRQEAGEIIDSISFGDLKANQQVRIWFSGPVAESYPAQVGAAQVMIVESKPTSQQTEPDFTGNINEVHSIEDDKVVGTILVEGKDIIKSSNKYVVTIKTDTFILGQNYETFDFKELEPGQKVKIWFSGPVRESYPAQVDAAKVMVVSKQNDDLVKLGNEFQMTIGQRVEFSDTALDIVFNGVTDDSRCAQDVTCVWQGEVSADVEIIGGDGSHTMTLTQPGLFYDFSIDSNGGYQIAFKVLPYPESEKQIEDDEYRLVLKVTQEIN
jgi:hypothetical protein